MNKNKAVYDYVIITGLEREIEKLKQENIDLKVEIDNLKTELENSTSTASKYGFPICLGN